MSLKESSPIPEGDQRSIDILQNLQNSDFFREDSTNATVQFYHLNNSSELQSGAQFSMPDFFNAVDFYVTHRVSENSVRSAMESPFGKVDVQDQGRIVVSIDTFRVTEMLEFSYRFLRRDQQNNP
ncbi:MAG TPA: hypothetical protein VLG12_07735 [Candidatus Saccharimonadales bacterium]|nr:hypothetical protein [Candidatus Saccharimonadales bacterium]